MVNRVADNRSSPPQCGHSSAELLPVLYDELRRIASYRMSQEPGGQTLQATALVHEAFLRITSSDESGNWHSRGHFIAAAAEAMRRILVEGARRKKSLKRGGGWQRSSLDRLCDASGISATDLLALDESLARLAEEHPEKAELVNLRFFVGLSIREAADALGISVSSANNYWAFARSWLHLEMSDPAAE